MEMCEKNMSIDSIQEMEIEFALLDFDELRKLPESSNNLQILAELERSTVCGRLLLSSLNESIQRQYEVLSSLYQYEVSLAKALGGRRKSYNRFLSEMQGFLERQGLMFDKSLLKLCHDKKLKNLIATVS